MRIEMLRLFSKRLLLERSPGSWECSEPLTTKGYGVAEMLSQKGSESGEGTRGCLIGKRLGGEPTASYKYLNAVCIGQCWSFSWKRSLEDVLSTVKNLEFFR